MRGPQLNKWIYARWQRSSKPIYGTVTLSGGKKDRVKFLCQSIIEIEGREIMRQKKKMWGRKWNSKTNDKTRKSSFSFSFQDFLNTIFLSKNSHNFLGVSSSFEILLDRKNSFYFWRKVTLFPRQVLIHFWSGWWDKGIFAPEPTTYVLSKPKQKGSLLLSSSSFCYHAKMIWCLSLLPSWA